MITILLQMRIKMKETYSKNYFEKYAALTLAKILSINSKQIIQDDRPDLRIETLNYGIEVTQALTPEEAVADIKKPLYAILKINPFDHLEADLKFVMQKIENAINRKEKKSKNYQRYDHNALYIFSHCHNLPESMLLDFFKSHSMVNSFYDHVFINCVDHIYEYDCQNDTIQQFYYQKDELITMNDIALDFEKHCQKPRRKIIIKAS